MRTCAVDQLEHQLHETLDGYSGATLLVSHNLEEIYRLCGELVVLDQGRVLARGSREEIFRRPPNRRTAELTGCKNFSRARESSDHSVEALDWGCALRVTDEMPHGAGHPLGHLGIRAHYIQINPAQSASEPPAENTFPCWLADATAGPFRVTLYLRLHAPPAGREDYHLQAEITRERWLALQASPFPWSVRLDPDRIVLLPD